MKSNSLLTYLLYALLGVLIITAGYKACQMQKEKQRKAQEEAEWQETLKKLYPEGDSTAGGSSYIERDSAAGHSTRPSVSPSDIEDAAPSASTNTKATTPKTTTTTKTTTATKTPPTSTAPGTTTTTTKTTTTKTTTPAVQGVGSGRWEVRAGTFSSASNARERLEQVIRMGYTNAEVRTANGKSAVIVLRTNDRKRADQAVDQLTRRGVDAAVFKH